MFGNHAGEGGLCAELVLNRDFEMTTLPQGARWAGNLLRTADNWQERKWFGNALWGWQLIADGGARGSIRHAQDWTIEDVHLAGKDGSLSRSTIARAFRFHELKRLPESSDWQLSCCQVPILGIDREMKEQT